MTVDASMLWKQNAKLQYFCVAGSASVNLTTLNYNITEQGASRRQPGCPKRVEHHGPAWTRIWWRCWRQCWRWRQQMPQQHDAPPGQPSSLVVTARRSFWTWLKMNRMSSPAVFGNDVSFLNLIERCTHGWDFSDYSPVSGSRFCFFTFRMQERMVLRCIGMWLCTFQILIPAYL